MNITLIFIVSFIGVIIGIFIYFKYLKNKIQMLQENNIELQRIIEKERIHQDILNRYNSNNNKIKKEVKENEKKDIKSVIDDFNSYFGS